jgi:hypothetical protein
MIGNETGGGIVNYAAWRDELRWPRGEGVPHRRPSVLARVSEFFEGIVMRHLGNLQRVHDARANAAISFFVSSREHRLLLRAAGCARAFRRRRRPAPQTSALAWSCCPPSPYAVFSVLLGVADAP